MSSIWSNDTKLKHFNALENDIEVDTVIIGGGIAGLLTAYKLSQRGVPNIVIEADRLCSGQTKNTTAKITSQHGEIYSKIAKHYGNELARQYAIANEKAIAEYKSIIECNNINCDFEEKNAYLYTTTDISRLKNELHSAQACGIDCYFTNKTDLPFKVKGAVVFKNQAQFNPFKFIDGIIDDLTFFENTRALKIVGNIIYTPKAKIYAKHIVVATHYPFINFPSFYFLKMSQERSYAVAIEKGIYNLDGMYIGIESNALSLRDYNDYILVGGGAHRTGVKPVCPPYNMLRDKCNELFPNHKIVYKWSAQDCITLDSIPYISKFGGDNQSIYVATGFNKWGMSTAMASADIISDMICGIKNENCDIFSADRFNLQANAKNLLSNTKETVKGFSKHLLPARDSIENVITGEAKEISYNGKKAGAYKDSDGKVYIVTLKCPHLKCKLEWNKVTKTWDCPCHGSRYSYKGELIDNPAQTSSILIAIE